MGVAEQNGMDRPLKGVFVPAGPLAVLELEPLPCPVPAAVGEGRDLADVPVETVTEVAEVEEAVGESGENRRHRG